MTKQAEVGSIARLGKVTRVARTGIWLATWVYLYLLVLLSSWVMLSGIAGGWNPMVITSGSMEPSIGVGDILMVSEHPSDLLGQQSVVVIDSGDGAPIAHRIFSVEGDRYVTKGDANALPDTDQASPEDVIGVGRLVVPAIGMPIVWLREGNLVPVVAVSLLTAGSLLAVGIAGVRRLRNRDGLRQQRTSSASMTAVRRLRTLVSVMIAMQYMLDPDQFSIEGSSLPSWGIPALVVTALIAVNRGTRIVETASQSSARLIALVLDTVLLVILVTTIGSSDIAWVLFALPIIEAALGFGIAGALYHWLFLTSFTLFSRVWLAESSDSGSSALITDLENILDQLGILFIVVIPGAYLAEQLIVDVTSQRKAAVAAKDRSTLLETVVEAGREVNRLGGQHVEALLDAAFELGFESADVAMLHPEHGWTVLASRGGEKVRLPHPGAAASGVRTEDLQFSTVIVDELDSSQVELDALAEAGISALVAILVRLVDSSRVVLRVGTTDSNKLTIDRIDAVRLLASQAGIALTNDQLLVELRGMRDEMTYQAHHDTLTGLHNRAGLRPALAAALEESDDHVPGIVFLDLNGFKQVNDRLGHDAGDELLLQIAQRLRAIVPTSDLVARLGGDEFVVLLHDASTNTAESTIDVIRTEIERPFDLETGTVSVGAAIGYALAAPSVGASELLRQADVAMYEAKRTGGQAMRYSRGLDEPRRRHTALAGDLPHALTSGQVTLAYQPIVHAASNRVVGLEALVRWLHPTQGNVTPPQLIDAALEAGIGSDVHHWIVNKAVAAAKLWGFGVDSNIFMTVNASAEEFDQPWVATNVLEAIADHGVPPSTIWVELSENLVRELPPVAASNLELLQSGGIQFMLDDFGEGQTSLSHMSRLPIGGVKLGREFVVGSMHSEADRIVLESVVDLSTRLGFVVVAEGVENDAEYQTVTSAGCQLVQGFLLHRPLDHERTGQLLMEQQNADNRPVVH